MTKPAENPEPSAGRVGTLRGAPVDVDLHLVGRVAAFLGVLVLAFSVIVLFLAGAHRNAQLNLLRQRGVPVTMTVTNCLELLGGSGSNGAGYSCRGSLEVSGHLYHAMIPGNAFYPVGSTLRVEVVPDDPALLVPVSQIAEEHPSGRVYLLPAALAGALVLGTGMLVFLRFRPPGRSSAGQPAFDSRLGRADVNRFGVAEGGV